MTMICSFFYLFDHLRGVVVPFDSNERLLCLNDKKFVRTTQIWIL